MEEALKLCLGGKEAFRSLKSALSSPLPSTQSRIGMGRGDGDRQGEGQNGGLELLSPPPRALGSIVKGKVGMKKKEREESGVENREVEVIGTCGDVFSFADSEGEAFVHKGNKGSSDLVSTEEVEKKREVVKRGGILQELNVGRRGGSKVELLRRVAAKRQVAKTGEGGKARGDKPSDGGE